MERSGPPAKEKTRKRRARKTSEGESLPESPRLTVNPQLLARFDEFGEQSSEFAREIVERSGTQSTTANHARLNIRVARTVFSKWSVEILTFLFTGGASRFQEIKKALGDISARVLSVKLARLERLGFVRRSVLDTRPPGVEYSLTEKGRQVARLGEPVFLYLRLTEGLLKLYGLRGSVGGAPRGLLRRRLHNSGRFPDQCLRSCAIDFRDQVDGMLQIPVARHDPVRAGQEHADGNRDDQGLGLGRRSGPPLDQIGKARNSDEESEAQADD